MLPHIALAQHLATRDSRLATRDSRLASRTSTLVGPGGISAALAAVLDLREVEITKAAHRPQLSTALALNNWPPLTAKRRLGELARSPFGSPGKLPVGWFSSGFPKILDSQPRMSKRVQPSISCSHRVLL